MPTLLAQKGPILPQDTPTLISLREETGWDLPKSRFAEFRHVPLPPEATTSLPLSATSLVALSSSNPMYACSAYKNVNDFHAHFDDTDTPPLSVITNLRVTQTVEFET